MSHFREDRNTSIKVFIAPTTAPFLLLSNPSLQLKTLVVVIAALPSLPV